MIREKGFLPQDSIVKSAFEHYSGSASPSLHGCQVQTLNSTIIARWKMVKAVQRITSNRKEFKWAAQMDRWEWQGRAISY